MQDRVGLRDASEEPSVFDPLPFENIPPEKDYRPFLDPLPHELRQRCLGVQDGWTDAQRIRRRQGVIAEEDEQTDEPEAIKLDDGSATWPAGKDLDQIFDGDIWRLIRDED